MASRSISRSCEMIPIERRTPSSEGRLDVGYDPGLHHNITIVVGDAQSQAPRSGLRCNCAGDLADDDQGSDRLLPSRAALHAWARPEMAGEIRRVAVVGRSRTQRCRRASKPPARATSALAAIAITNSMISSEYMRGMLNVL